MSGTVVLASLGYHMFYRDLVLGFVCPWSCRGIEEGLGGFGENNDSDLLLDPGRQSSPGFLRR